MYRHVIHERDVVAVAPVLTVLSAPINVDPGLSAVRVEIINDDMAQTLNVHFDKSEASTGPWNQSDYKGLEGILPGTARTVVIDARYLQYIRLTGTASGAGLSARVSVVCFTGDSTW